MKRYLALLTVLIVIFLNITTVFAVGESTVPQRKISTQATTETSTFTATIVKIDAATNTVVLRDQSGKLWEFIIGPKSGIDLSAYKVGDKVTATVGAVAATDGPTLRARISKTELIKLQKK
jgi:hypothetical protein